MTTTTCSDALPELTTIAVRARLGGEHRRRCRRAQGTPAAIVEEAQRGNQINAALASFAHPANLGTAPASPAAFAKVIAAKPTKGPR